MLICDHKENVLNIFVSVPRMGLTKFDSNEFN